MLQFVSNRSPSPHSSPALRARGSVRPSAARLAGLLALWACLLVTPSTAAAATGGAAQYRTGKPDPRIGSVPAAVQQGVFADPERFVGPLVQALAQGIDEPRRKVKILHDWVAENIGYDCEAFFSGAQIDTSWVATLRQRKSICHGYAGLLAKMCELAGIRAVVISGYGRGYAFVNSGGAEDPRQVNHAWNAVEIGRGWLLVDATWDAGHVEGRNYIKQYGTSYLFQDPRQFVYTHFPSDPQWQLLDKPLDVPQFAALPYLPGRFFEYGLRLVTPLARSNAAGTSAQFTLETPDDVAMLVRLKSAAGTEVDRRTLVAQDLRECRVIVLFPQPGRWSVQVHVKRRGEPGPYRLAASLEFEASSRTVSRVPATFSAYEELGGCLLSPLLTPLDNDKPVPFRIRLRRPTDVFLAVGSRPWQKLQPQAADLAVCELTASIPRGQPVKLVAADPAAAGKFTVLVDFTPGPG